ncbi:MAG: hypothetical protein ACFHU9_14485 [Fluviicola sp.]
MFRCVLLLLIVSTFSAEAQELNVPFSQSQEEFERLNSLDFTTLNLDSFPVDPFELALDPYSNPLCWYDVKNEFNYKGSQVPQGVRFLTGNPEEIQSENPKTWKTKDFFVQKQYSFTPTGRTMSSIATDSTVYSYDNQGKLRQITGFPSGSSGSFNYALVKNYNASGNLISNAEYYSDGDSNYYLEEYQTFKYLSNSDGFYIRQDVYVVYDEEIPEIEQTTRFHLYSSDGQKQISYQGSGNSVKTITTYNYQEVNGSEYLSEMSTYNLARSVSLQEQEIIRRDAKARIIFEKTFVNSGETPFVDSDSTIYISDREKHVYKETFRGPYPHSLIIYKFDEKGDLKRREIRSLFSDTPEKIEILTTYQNFYMENGNVHQIVDVTYWDGRTDRDLLIQEFRSTPFTDRSILYAEDPKLIALIEKCIPPDKR